MLNDSLLSLSFDSLKDFLFFQVTIFHVALIYILTYVIYKALGRYIYFKPQEHASKINRTFLALSLLVVLLHAVSPAVSYLPITPEYQWLYVPSILIILIAPMSILMHWVMWKSHPYGNYEARDWQYRYLPIPHDYYKTSVGKSERDGGTTSYYEVEGVKSTADNIHSDALLHVFALVIFLLASWYWAYLSYSSHGFYSYSFFVFLCIPIAALFTDQTIFSWIQYLERKDWLKRKI